MTVRLPWLAPASALRIALDELARDAAWLATFARADLAGLTTEPLGLLVQRPDGDTAIAAALARVEQPRSAGTAVAPHRRPRGAALAAAAPAPGREPPPVEPARAAARRLPAPSPAGAGRELATAGADRVRALIARGAAAMPHTAMERGAAAMPQTATERGVARRVTGLAAARGSRANAIATAARGLGGFAARIPGGDVASARPLASPAAAASAGTASGPRPVIRQLPAAPPRRDPGTASRDASHRAPAPGPAVLAPRAPEPPDRATAPIGSDAPTSVAALASPPRGLGGLLDWWTDREGRTGRVASSAVPATLARTAPAILPAPIASVAPLAVASAALASPAPSLGGPAIANPVPAGDDAQTPEAVARVLERVLVGELRRHGIPLEDA